MFNFGSSVGHSTYRNMVRILYPTLDVSCLPSPKRNVDEFLIRIHEVDSYKFP